MSVASKPSLFWKERNKPLTANEYIDSLKDGRDIYIYGEKVKDVTTHPAFRNSVASVSQLYTALHNPESKDSLTWQTDTGNGGYTHKFFRYARSSEDLFEQRDAIADWSRSSYGWMGRTPDYKAAFACSLGHNPDFYGPFKEQAQVWYKRIQEGCLYLNHAIVNPPVDRQKSSSEVPDVYIRATKETDAGIYVSGAKVVATGSALTHYNVIAQTPSQDIGKDPSVALMFIASMNADGVKLISRHSYEASASLTGSPFDNPLSSRFDENDSILVFDNVFIPWENVLIYRDIERCHTFFPQSGFTNLASMQGCVRLAVKLDFLAGLLYRCLECTGTLDFRGVQAKMGQVIAWRNLFWTLTDGMCANPEKRVNGCFMPDPTTLETYRVMAPKAYVDIKNIVETTVASGLIYLPSSRLDLKNPEINKYLQRYVRGSNNIDHEQRIKIMKLMWDAIGTEFGGRHELYELNYAGSEDTVRMNTLRQSRRSGNLKKMTDMVDKCMSDYDLNGWTKDHLHNGEDFFSLDQLSK